MTPLMILIFLVAFADGKPRGSYYYPSSTPSPVPSYLFNNFNLNLRPTVASYAPQLVNIPTRIQPQPIYNLPLPTPSTFLSGLPPRAPEVNLGSQPLASAAPSVLPAAPPTASSNQPIPSTVSSLLPGGPPTASSVINIGSPSASVAPSVYPGVLPTASSWVNFGSLGIQSLPLQYYGQSFQSLPLSFQYVNFPQPQVDIPRVNYQPVRTNFGRLLPVGDPRIPLNSQPPPLPAAPSRSPSVVNLQRNEVPNVTPLPLYQNSEGVIIQKHIYVHVPPEEPEIRNPPKLTVAPPRRHYKIIFIKAPTPPVPTLPPPPQEEERTIIYVLVKKPEEQQEIKFETPPPTTPPKPEVYFIKYDSKKDSIDLPSPIHRLPVAGARDSSVEVSQENINIRLGAPEDTVKESGNENGDSDINESNREEDDDDNRVVSLKLNKASLTGGSALSLAVTENPDIKVYVSGGTDAPDYDPSRRN